MLVILCPFSSWALNYEEYSWIHNSNHCSNYFEYYEQKYNIPQHLLRSVSVVESGRWHKKANIYLPWPWAVNQGGKAHYFSSKLEAISAVKKMLERGETNIDIGCMQINLHHHPDAFLNLEQAFDPQNNIEYAANFLKNHYEQVQNWQQAVAFYHSQADIGKAYALKVSKLWLGYVSNKLHHNHCTSNNGELVPCKDNEAVHLAKETLPLVGANVKKHAMVSMPRKDLKRLRSAMVPYSINEELN